ncbi:MAG TPA: phosphopyruvate hydratase [Nonomuraea sp.]|nr:phosphopyruvate hydratase [Nonomuraea sp.]
MNPTVERVHARQILDSRGRPTVEVDVLLTDGTVGRASAPSGASTGRHEAHELRDGDPDDYGGHSVRRAVTNVRTDIDRALRGRPADQAAIDDRLRALDGTANLARLGANAVLATSLAVARAAATAQRVPLYRYVENLLGEAPASLPMPMTNILSGGAHAGRAMDVQDFLVVPIGASSYPDALAMIGSVRSAAADLLREAGGSTLLADEGGLSPRFGRVEDSLELMLRSIERADLVPGADAAIAVDVAASQLRDGSGYRFTGEERVFSSQDLGQFLGDLARRYPLISIEDPLDEDDWDGWLSFTGAMPGVQVVGDDLFATNRARLDEGIRRGAANAVLIKLNQNGTLSGTLDVLATARSAGYATVVSARSGETEDPFIADLAVGSGAGQIKIGSVRNSERLAKYNQLLRIAEDESLPFAGRSGFAGHAVASSQPTAPQRT